jgi:predicted kinase
MHQPTPIPLPRLIVVTGRPGSGKTSLAKQLAQAIRCPAICRDEIKEGWIHTTGQSAEPGDESARKLYEWFFEVVKLLLSYNVTLIAEAAFQHKLWAPKLEVLQPIARIRIIVCSVEPQIARDRCVDRGLADSDRERFHPDPAIPAAREGRTLPLGVYDPPHLDVPTLNVDTSEGYQPDLQAVVSFALG